LTREAHSKVAGKRDCWPLEGRKKPEGGNDSGESKKKRKNLMGISFKGSSPRFQQIGEKVDYFGGGVWGEGGHGHRGDGVRPERKGKKRGQLAVGDGRDSFGKKDEGGQAAEKGEW